MLLRTLHIPRLYADPPDDSENTRMYCSLMLGLLQDTLENCVLFVDIENQMTREMFCGLEKWPWGYRQAAKELLTRMRQRNRFVKVDPHHTVAPNCRDWACQHAVSIARHGTPDAIIASPKCSGCASFEYMSSPLIDLTEYPISGFSDLRRRSVCLALSDGEWEAKDFESKVWLPLFQYAKHVKIFDRMIGEHLTDGIKRGHSARINANYRTCLTWVFEQYLKHSRVTPGRVFEVTCGLNSDLLSGSEIAAAAVALHEFASELSSQHGFALTMSVRVEDHVAEMRHARFLFTDQISLMVERGFDLLRRDGRVRDVVITHFPDPGTIEKEARRLVEVQLQDQ